MNINLWKKRDKLSELIFTVVLGITVLFTFAYDIVKLDKSFLFIFLGILESTLLVFIFSRGMNLYEMKKNEEKINFSKLFSLILYIIMFGYLGKTFLFIK